MVTWVRRIITLLVVAAATAGGTLWWLYDGDVEQGVQPVVDDVVDGVDKVMDEPTPEG